MIKEKIYIFGRGTYFREKLNTFQKEYTICGFIDNAVEYEAEESTLHMPVYNPSRIKTLPKYDIYCVSADFISMWHQLKELGVEDERIKFGAMIQPMQPGIELNAFSKGETIVSKGSHILYSSDVCGEIIINSIEDLKGIIRETARKSNNDITCVTNLSTKPVSRMFGSERGKAVDRLYIEEFLRENTEYIYGTVLEIANRQYTVRFGGDKVRKSIISHVKECGKDSVICNFETGEGVIDELVDCIICTQTLQYIFDLQSAIRNIYRLLKPGGTALITVPGIKPLCEYDNKNWGEHWSFTSESVKKLCSLVCESDAYEVKQYGNVKTVTAYLYGLCVEDMKPSDFEYQDSQYPFLVCAKIMKV